MRRCSFLVGMALAAMISTPLFADSNAFDDIIIVNSETIDLGAGPFFHGGLLGDPLNTTVTNLNFTGGFTATHIRFSGTTESLDPFTWGSEADIQVRRRLPGGGGTSDENNWQSPAGNGAYTSYDFDSATALAAPLNPASVLGSTWEVEFFESFDDDAAVADAQSLNVMMTFEEQAGGVFDENGVWSLGSFGDGDTASSVGEFALPGLYDTYSVTLESDGQFSFFTEFDPSGYTGSSPDTEIAIFDSAGVLLANNDDDIGLFSGLYDLDLTAGDYTLAVATYNTTFADGFVVNPGGGTGDYIINASFTAIPEPGTFGLLGLACCALVAYRRKS